jgi:opacity protein-like surface antigen
MGSLKALTLAGGVALLATTAARAADLPPPPPPEPAPIAAPAMEYGGWYLRGDVGLGVNRSPKLRTSPDPLAGLTQGGCSDPYNGGYQDCYSNITATYDFRNQTLSQSTFVGLGIGYQLNQWLRADATLEWRGGAHMTAVDQLNERGTYTQVFPDGTNSGGQSYGRPLRNFYRGNISSIVGLVNGYIDLGTFWGITPYIGAGVGFAQNRLSGLTDQGYLYNSLNGQGYPTGGYWQSGRKTNFAWALMAGLSYSVSANLKLEIGYRYMNLGKMGSGASHCFNGDGSNGGYSSCNWRISSNKLESHDIRVGMRWMLGGEPAAPAQGGYFPTIVRSRF